ncbi:MAG: thermonuclease family protein [Patescibacteria group bacterium]|mgnify:CR=1 FL=1
MNAPRLKKITLSFATFFIILILYLLDDASTQSSPPDSLAPPSVSRVLVTRIIDGDTIELETGDKVRYIGVNTPESVDPRREVQCFGIEASVYNKNLVLNKKVRLEKDISETDKFGRLLRYIYLEDGTFINLKLINDGYGYASAYPPDVAHSEEFVDAQRQARENGLGLWSACEKS